MPAGNTAVQAVYTHEIATSFDILKPEVWSSLMKSHGNQKADYFKMLTSLGFKVPSMNETFRHYEDDWIHETVAAVAPIVVGGAGADTTFTVAPASLDSENRFYLRERDHVLLQNGVRAMVKDIDVTTPTATVVTISPLDVSAVAQVTAADELAITTNSFDEGTNQPDGRFSGTRKYENDMQIIKETLSVTGTNMTDGNWFDEVSYAGENGEKITGYYVKGQEDAEYRLALSMEGACLFGTRNDNPNTVDPDTGKQVRTTEGTYTYMENNGNTVNYTPGSFTVAKFNEINKIADKEVAPEYYCAFLGIDIHDELDDTFVDYNKETNISFTSDITGGKKRIDIGFEMLNKSGRRYGFKRFGSFSNQKTYGATGYDYSSQGMFIPLGMNKALDSNAKAEKLPTIGMRYKQLGSYNRFSEVWDVSGAGNGNKVTQNDSKNLYLRSHIGSHNMVGNQMVLLRP